MPLNIILKIKRKKEAFERVIAFYTETEEANEGAL